MPHLQAALGVSVQLYQETAPLAGSARGARLFALSGSPAALAAAQQSLLPFGAALPGGPIAPVPVMPPLSQFSAAPATSHFAPSRGTIS